ncbi:MAG: sensor histidine kinase, partial [Candidatus Omnitrophica bacterium]|nr:sensor histidine kinase [Candidatus Omnitrophota bacterium]
LSVSVPTAVRAILEMVLRNAAEAYRERPGFDGKKCPVRVSLEKDGDEFRIKVKDDAGGIKDPDRIFNKGYTTKKARGGYGLYFARNIALAHGMEIRARNAVSEDSRGTLSISSLNPSKYSPFPLVPFTRLAALFQSWKQSLSYSFGMSFAQVLASSPSNRSPFSGFIKTTMSLKELNDLINLVCISLNISKYSRSTAISLKASGSRSRMSSSTGNGIFRRPKQLRSSVLFMLPFAFFSS